MKTKATKTKPQFVTSMAAMGRHYGVNRRTVQNWLGEGMPGKVDGKYWLKHSDAWLVQNEKDVVTGRRRKAGETSVVDRHSGKLRTKEQLDQIQLKLKQLDLDEKEGHLIAVDDVERLFVRTLNYAKSLLLQITDKIQPQLPSDLTDEVTSMIRDVVRSEVNEALTALADLITKDPG